MPRTYDISVKLVMCLKRTNDDTIEEATTKIFNTIKEGFNNLPTKISVFENDLGDYCAKVSFSFALRGVDIKDVVIKASDLLLERLRSKPDEMHVNGHVFSKDNKIQHYNDKNEGSVSGDGI